MTGWRPPSLSPLDVSGPVAPPSRSTSTSSLPGSHELDADASFWDLHDEVKTLGKGSYGTVKLVRVRSTGHMVAVKAVSKDSHTPPEEGGVDEKNEAEVLDLLRRTTQAGTAPARIGGRRARRPSRQPSLAELRASMGAAPLPDSSPGKLRTAGVHGSPPPAASHYPPSSPGGVAASLSPLSSPTVARRRARPSTVGPSTVGGTSRVGASRRAVGATAMSLWQLQSALGLVAGGGGERAPPTPASTTGATAADDFDAAPTSPNDAIVWEDLAEASTDDEGGDEGGAARGGLGGGLDGHLSFHDSSSDECGRAESDGMRAGPSSSSSFSSYSSLATAAAAATASDRGDGDGDGGEDEDEGEGEDTVRLLDVYESPGTLFLVMRAELGGDLSARLDSLPGRACEESEARTHFAAVLRGLEGMHAAGVVHRDVKPANVLLSAEGEGRLGDFGLAERLPGWGAPASPNSLLVAPAAPLLTAVVGTHNNMAPEMVLCGHGECAGYGTPVDCWQAGVLLFELLFGEHPFARETEIGTLAAILAADYTLPAAAAVSDEARDLVRRLLVADPNARLTASEALAHRWVSGESPRLVPDYEGLEARGGAARGL